MIYRVSTIPVEVNSRLAAARLPLHVGKLPVESMEDLSCDFLVRNGCFPFFWCQKTEHSMFWGTINRSITHTLSGDPAGTKPPSRLKLLLRKRCGTRPDFWNNEGSSSAICPTFGLTCFFFSAGFAPARCSEKLLETSSARGKSYRIGVKNWFKTYTMFLYTTYTMFLIYNLIFYPSNKKKHASTKTTFSSSYRAAAPGNSKGSISTNQLSPQTTWHRKCQGSWQFGWMENGEEMAGEPRKIALKNFVWSKLKVVIF